MSIVTVITYTIFLPLMLSPINANQRLGAYWWSGSEISRQYIVYNQWGKLDSPWMEIEAQQGIYVWPVILDNNVRELQNNGSPILINFHNSPLWAVSSKIPCRLPDAQYVDDFINFVSATIDRYNPTAIEIWNEPEIPNYASEVAGWCCGCIDNPLEYTGFLNQVYDAVKLKYPHVIIIGGALTQDNSEWARIFFSSNPHMDAVSFHYYQNYNHIYPNLDTSGLQARIADINNRTNVPVWMTETSFLCNEKYNPCLETFRPQQEQWLNLVYPLSGVEKLFWFSQNEVWWNRCNMLHERANILYPVFGSFTSLVENNHPNSAQKTIIRK
jgi:hypothetical protein